MTFGTRIRQLRKEHDLTLRELAEQVDIDFTYLSKIENDRGPAPAEDTIRRLSKVLNTDAEELVLLAKKMPAAFEQDLLERPAQHVADLYRSMAGKRYTDEEWRRVIKALRDQGASS